MVVVYHLYPQLIKMGYAGWWPHFLTSGVDIFFVISGFVMTITTCGRSITPLKFYLRRIVRIVPLYWILTTVVVIITLAAPGLAETSAFSLRHILLSYVFIPTPHPVVGGMYPPLILGWTLNYEMFFYLLFGLALLLPERIRYRAMLGALVLLALSGLLDPPANTLLSFYASDIILEFGFGVLIALAFRKGRTAPRQVGWLLVVAGAALLAAPLTDIGIRAVFWGVPAAMIVFGALSIERTSAIPEYRAAHLLGDASYSIYLTHGLLLAALSKGWRTLHLDALPGGWAGFCIAGPLAAAIGGTLVYLIVERPVTDAARRLAGRHI